MQHTCLDGLGPLSAGRKSRLTRRRQVLAHHLEVAVPLVGGDSVTSSEARAGVASGKCGRWWATWPRLAPVPGFREDAGARGTRVPGSLQGQERGPEEHGRETALRTGRHPRSGPLGTLGLVAALCHSAVTSASPTGNDALLICVPLVPSRGHGT